VCDCVECVNVLIAEFYVRCAHRYPPTFMTVSNVKKGEDGSSGSKEGRNSTGLQLEDILCPEVVNLFPIVIIVQAELM